MDNPKLIRTSAGEEILCKVEYNGDSYTIKDPLVMIPAGDHQLGFVPWLPYCDWTDGLTVDKSFVSFIAEPSKVLISEYHSSITGLVVPTEKSVTSTVPSLKITE
tara:strand:- start:145 stop:459 length:315 start_codon:yes stop_codon:yes gene_type:complete